MVMARCVVLPSKPVSCDKHVVQVNMPKQPDYKWAQRPDKIMLTLNVANLDPAKADIKVNCVTASTTHKEQQITIESAVSGT